MDKKKELAEVELLGSIKDLEKVTKILSAIDHFKRVASECMSEMETKYLDCILEMASHYCIRKGYIISRIKMQIEKLQGE